MKRAFTIAIWLTAAVLFYGLHRVSADNPTVISPPTGGTPGGSGTQIQYRLSGSTFGGIAGSSWDGTTLVLPGISLSSPTISNATALYVPYVNASKLLVTDINGLYWDAADKQYGIGTITPSYTFDVIQNNPAEVGYSAKNTNSGGNAGFVFSNDQSHTGYWKYIGSGNGGFFADSALFVSDGNTGMVVAGGTMTLTSADYAIRTIGKGFRIATGTNAKIGSSTLVSGVKFVSNTSVTANSVVIPSIKAISGTSTGVWISSITAGSGFNAAGAVTDNSSFNYVIIDPF